MTESDADDIMGWIVEASTGDSGLKEHYYSLYVVASAAERAVAQDAGYAAGSVNLKAIMRIKRSQMNHLGLSPGQVVKRHYAPAH